MRGWLEVQRGNRAALLLGGMADRFIRGREQPVSKEPQITFRTAER